MAALRTIVEKPIKPKSNYSTKQAFEKFKGPYKKKSYFSYTPDNLIRDMHLHKNSLENTVYSLENNLYNLIKFLPRNNCLTLPRITGSGSAVFVLFKKEKEVTNYKKNINLDSNLYWIKKTLLVL